MSESKLIIRDVNPGATPPTVPEVCPKCRAEWPQWRGRQISVAQPGHFFRGVEMTCTKCGHHELRGEGSPVAPNRSRG